MGQKTVAEHVWDVYSEFFQDNFKHWGDKPTAPIVSWGDCGLLDRAASRAEHTKLLKMHPLNRHKRILAALHRESLKPSSRFEKVYLSKAGGYRGGAATWVGYRLLGVPNAHYEDPAT